MKIVELWKMTQDLILLYNCSILLYNLDDFDTSIKKFLTIVMYQYKNYPVFSP